MKVRAAPPQIATRAPRIATPKVRAPVYGTPQHRAWAATVIQRSGGRCQGVGCPNPNSGGRLFADHIHELRDGGGFDLENGVALCGSCHTRKTLAQPTQSKEPPAGVFKAELEMARDVRDGRIALPLLPIIYELPHRLAKDGGWKNRVYWPLINPNMGRSVDEEFLAREVLKAEEQGPQALALIASQHFNVQIGQSLMGNAWAGAEFWASRADPAITLESILDRSEVVIVGIDGGGLDDLFGLAVLGRDKVTKNWLLWSHAWAHTSVLERRKSIAARLAPYVSLEAILGNPPTPEVLNPLRDAPTDSRRQRRHMAQSRVRSGRWFAPTDWSCRTAR